MGLFIEQLPRQSTKFSIVPVQKGGLIHHSDRGGQYLSIKYTERLAEAKIALSVGSVGDSYDNALAETINGFYKTKLVHRQGPWRSMQDLAMAILGWVVSTKQGHSRTILP